MKAGTLNRRIDLQKKTIVQSPTGAQTITWASQRIVWAANLPVRGREYMAADQLRADVEVRFVMRRQRDLAIDATWRVVAEGLVHGVKSVIQAKTDRTMIELMCSVGQSQE